MKLRFYKINFELNTNKMQHYKNIPNTIICKNIFEYYKFVFIKKIKYVGGMVKPMYPASNYGLKNILQNFWRT